MVPILEVFGLNYPMSTSALHFPSEATLDLCMIILHLRMPSHSSPFLRIDSIN